MSRLIKGSGGGGGKGGSGGSGGSASESPDSLRSEQFARVLDLISEGEIEGLVNGLQSIYLDDTPLKNADGSFNFQGVSVDTRNGTQDQSPIAGFTEIESEVAVSVEVKATLSVTRRIINVNANAARITIGIPQLTYQDPSTGNLTGTSVDIAIDVQSNGGGFITAIYDTFSGKTTSRYQRNYRVALTGSAPWDIRIRRITPDSIQVNLQNKTIWESYTELVESRLRYPNSALVGLQVNSFQFQGIPKRSYDVKLLRIQIPSNYDPITRIYTGMWDGTFTVAWSDNPAWCFYDLLTNDRYGLGAFIDSTQVDKWSLYAIGQYCDELVSDGFGSTEPRFTCNLYIQARAQAYTVIGNMASIFRGMTYWQAGAITPVADKPADAVALFNNANVIDGKFNYTGSARTARHTVALVAWNDPDDRYVQKIEYVDDPDGIARYGVIETSLTAFGCTSRGQANRIGKWLLYSERLETETVSFSTGLEGLVVYPGAVIKTVDQFRAGKRFGGRVTASTTTSVTIDSPILIESGKTYTLSLAMPDGSIVDRPLTNSIGSASTLTFTTVLTALPQSNAVWVVAASDLTPELWRIVSVVESAKNIAQVTALAHNASKYGAIEQNLILEKPPTSKLTTKVESVKNITVVESLYEISPGIVAARAVVSWTGTTGIYVFSYLNEFENWVTYPETRETSATINNIDSGNYTFSVIQKNALGYSSPANKLQLQILGKTAPPSDVTGFSIIAISGIATASWNLQPDLDVQIGGRIIIRHSPLTVSATWNDSVVLEEFGGNAITGIVPLITGTYFAKALDSSGNYSVNAASFVATEGMVTGFTTIATVTEQTAFSGTKTNIVKVGSAIQLDALTTMDTRSGLIDTWDFIDSATGLYLNGTYLFTNAMDLSTVAVRRVQGHIKASQFSTTDLIDTRTENIDDWSYVDGDVVQDCDATLYARTTNDDPAGTPTWGPWTQFFVSDFNCRALQFRLDLLSGQQNHNISISELSVTAKIPA